MTRAKNNPQATEKDVIEVMKETGDFENQFRDKEDPTRLQKGLTPVEVLGKLGYQQVRFENLDADLQEAIKNHHQSWYGKPVNILGSALPERIIMTNSDGTVIYFFRTNRFPNGREDYGWSRLEKREDGYYIAEMNHDNNIGEVIGQVSFLEILHPQKPKGYPRYSESNIRIPFAPEAAAMQTREQIERL